MNKEIQSVLLVLLGGAVLRISLGDTYLRYVKDWMQPFLVVSGVVLLALGLLSAWYDGFARRPAEGEHGHEDERGTGRGTEDRHGAAAAADPEVPAGHLPGDGHDHTHGPRVAWAVLLPVLAIFLVAPPALGSYAAARDSGGVTAPADSSFPPLPDGDVVELPILDYSTRAVWDEGATLAGRTIALTGFVSPDDEGGWYLTRIALSCCAADGRAVKVRVQGADAPPVDSWVRLTGQWVPGGETLDDGAIPAVEAVEVEPVEEPRDPYE